MLAIDCYRRDSKFTLKKKILDQNIKQCCNSTSTVEILIPKVETCEKCQGKQKGFFKASFKAVRKEEKAHCMGEINKY